MLTSGFTNAPVSRFLVFYVVATSLLASITDSKYLIHIHVVPHIWVYRQFWRLLTWQASQQSLNKDERMNGLMYWRRHVIKTPPRCSSRR